MTLGPSQSAAYVAAIAKHVTVNQEGVKRLAEKVANSIKSGAYDFKQWKGHPLHPKVADQAAVDWIFLVDLLNFSFWTDKQNKYEVEYRGQTYTGYWALCAAVNRAQEEGIALTSAKYFANITADQAKHVFRSKAGDSVMIPLLDERVRVMRESGAKLVEKFDGSFVNCLNQCGQSAQTLLQLITEHFPSFRDHATYPKSEGKHISLLKRAQILVADLWACFEGQGLGTFHDIDTLTMFADYRVPQVLVYFDALRYSDHLKEVLKSDTLMKNGDELEVEIRALSIHAVEMTKEQIREQFKREGITDKSVNSILLDFYLWDYRRQNVEEVDKAASYHKVRCIYY